MNEYAKEISKIPLLSDEETKQLVIAMQNGDDEARKKLIKHNLRLVLKLVGKYQLRINLPIEDLISIGSFGLIKAIDGYDLSRNVKLSTVAYIYIENTFRRHIYLSTMKKRDYSNDISLQDQVYVSKDGDGLTLEDVVEDDGLPLDEVVDLSMRVEVIQNILKKLTRNERELLFLRYGIYDDINHTLEEIADQQDVSRETIRLRERNALRKLKHPKITRQVKDFFEK